MQHNWLLYIAAFATAFAVSLVSTPYVKRLAQKFGAVSYPRKRGMKNEPIPQMGGLAMVLGFLISIGMMVFFVPEMQTKAFVGFIVGAAIIVTEGILDDIFIIKPKQKLVFQILAACVVIFSGTQINIEILPFSSVLKDIGFLSSLSWPMTLLWIIGIMNAVNLIDGLDGLAAGISSICALCLMILCVISGTPLAVALTAALAGSCFGFLPRNFNPAEIIMGDTGAMFLGYVLAVSSIIGVYKIYAVLSLFIAVFALALPIFDTLFALIRRAVTKKPLFKADRGHMHHRLIDSGFTEIQTVVILYGISLVAGILAILIALENIYALVVMAAFVFVASMMLFVYRKRTK